MDSAIRVVRAIQIAMLVSVVLYVIVGEGIGSVPRLNNPVLFYVLSLVTITIVGVILVVRRTLVLQSAAALAARPNDAATLSRWRAGHMMPNLAIISSDRTASAWMTRWYTAFLVTELCGKETCSNSTSPWKNTA